MSLIHEKLYQSKTLDTVDLTDYVRALVRMLVQAYIACGNLPQTSLPRNELVTNGLHHRDSSGRFERIFPVRFDIGARVSDTDHPVMVIEG